MKLRVANNTGKNQSLTDQAFVQLKQDLVFGYFSFGDKLNIEELKRRYKMGGTPIREALNQLVSWSVVEALPLKGFRVAPVTKMQAQEVYQARLLVEKDMLSKSVANGGDDWEAQCLACCHRLRKCLSNTSFNDKQDFNKWFSMYLLFHHAVFFSGSSDCLWQFEQQLLLRSQQYEFVVYAQLDCPLEYLKEQFHLMELLASACLENNINQASDAHERGIVMLMDLINTMGGEADEPIRRHSE